MCAVWHTKTMDPPRAPHTTADKPSCTACHDGKKVKAAPANTHQGRTDQMCAICHAPVSGGVPKIPHTLEGRSDCTMCHTKQ